MDDRILLAIDNGTQSVRTIAFDPAGHVLASSKIPIEPYREGPPGHAEQDVDVYFDALCQSTRDVLGQGIDPAQIVGVAVTTQRATVVPVDREGTALRPALTWLDQREATDLPSLPLPLTLAFSAVGQNEKVRQFRRHAEVNWLAQHEPEVWAKTHKVLLLSGYHLHRLTGRFVDSVGSQVGYLPFNYAKQRWCGPWEWQWKALAVRRNQLPDLVKPGSRIGAIHAKAAAATGLVEGTPVFAAGSDKACEVLGSGALSPETGCISYGTTATFNAASERFIEPIRYYPAYSAAIPDAFNIEVQVFRGFWMVEWFKEQFGHPERSRAAELGVAAEALFDELVRSTPPGAMGLVLQPYWTPGLRTPGRDAKGAIIGFGDVHTRAHLYRSILEGLAYGVREGMELIEGRTGTRTKRLRVSGGGAQSDEVMQITADVFDLPAERPHTLETSALGAAMNVAVGAGIHRTYEEAVARMTRPGQRFEPRPESVRIYDAIYRRVYTPMYGRLQPLYSAIRDVVGYPT